MNFRFSYWEDKLFSKRTVGNSILASLRPEGMVSMRLGNPTKTDLFDRCPRSSVNSAGVKGITSQSSALKYKQFQFSKLGEFLRGDLVQLEGEDDIRNENGEVQSCSTYLHIKSFTREESLYCATGDIFIHSSSQVIQRNAVQLESHDCYVSVKNKRAQLKRLEDLKFNMTLRANDKVPKYSKFVYNEDNPSQMEILDPAALLQIETRLQHSLDDPAVVVPVNVHLDDASMVATKMWKSASVVSIQLAGAESGYKGSDSNNMIIALSPTLKISLKSIFENLIADLVNLQEDGFEAFDCFSNAVVKVKLPVACIQGDLPAKGEVTPFTGHRADVFCSRNLYSKSTGQGFDIKRTMQTLQDQIQQIQNAATRAEMKQLGVQYGLDIENLDTILTDLNKFDLTKDLPADILHHFLLGWMKKTLKGLKSDFLSPVNLDKLCAVMDKIILWKEYRCRTTSNALRTVASQIGRNIKALTQVMWYPLYLLIGQDPGAHRDLEAILRTLFYLSKIGYMMYNETVIVWTPFMIRVLRQAIHVTAAFFGRRMESVLEGPKAHDLQFHLIEDLVRHGNPASYDCSAGESKMRVQKLKHQFSNKSAPSIDVATKVMKTEIVRHIFDGGVLDAAGSTFAHPNVLAESRRTKAFREILGMEMKMPSYGGFNMMINPCCNIDYCRSGVLIRL